MKCNLLVSQSIKNTYAKKLDFFPTPLWATRALFKYSPISISGNIWECASGNGDITTVLEENGLSVYETDIVSGTNFLDDDVNYKCDWVITNPPFTFGEQFVLKSLNQATKGVAMFCRFTFLESIKRYNSIYSEHPPTHVLIFTERVGLTYGKTDKKAPTGVMYCWIIWDKTSTLPTQLIWIPPCKKKLTNEGDYDV